MTVVVLAATLIAQNWQFVRSERDKKDAAMDAQWQDTLKMISTPGQLLPGMVALQPFLKSPKYRDPAEKEAVELLAGSTDEAFFASWFGPAFVPAGWNNIGGLVALDRALLAGIKPLWREYSKDKKTDRSKLSPEEKNKYDYIEHAVPIITAEIGSVLETERPHGKRVNLSGTYFLNGDWRGVDLSGANIENIHLVYMNIKDTKLDQISQCAGTDASHTAWWEASKISAQLLGYLRANYKLDPSDAHGPRSEGFTQEQYDAAVKRLQDQAQ